MHAGVGQRLANRTERALDERVDEPLELGPRDASRVAIGQARAGLDANLGGLHLREVPLGLNHGLAHGLHGAARQRGLARGAQFAQHQAHQRQVDVVAAQVRVATGGEHLEHAGTSMARRRFSRSSGPRNRQTDTTWTRGRLARPRTGDDQVRTVASPEASIRIPAPAPHGDADSTATKGYPFPAAESPQRIVLKALQPRCDQ